MACKLIGNIGTEDKDQQISFHDWSWDQWYTGAKYLIDADAATENPTLESCIALLIQCKHLLLGKEPPRGHPLQLLMGKLVPIRLGILLDPNSESFDPVQWVQGPNLDMDIDICKLRHLRDAVSDFFKNVPKNTVIPDWVASFKSALKDQCTAAKAADVQEAARTQAPTEVYPFAQAQIKTHSLRRRRPGRRPRARGAWPTSLGSQRPPSLVAQEELMPQGVDRIARAFVG